MLTTEYPRLRGGKQSPEITGWSGLPSEGMGTLPPDGHVGSPFTGHAGRVERPPDDPERAPPLARSLGRGRGRGRDVVTAVWEACANAVEHPLHPRSREIVVEAEAGSALVSVSVRDSGRWHERPSVVARGYGLRMVSGLMDDVLIDRGRTGPR